MRPFRDIARDLAYGPTTQKGLSPSARGSSIVFGSNMSPAGGRFAGASARRHLEAYAGQSDAIDWVTDCLNVICETASNADYYFEDPATGKPRPKTRGEAEAYQRTAPDDLANLVASPNPWMSYEELIELTIIDYLLTGDAFWLKFRPDEDGERPLAIYRLSPALVEVIPGKEELIKSYKYSVPGMSPVFFDAEDVIHIRRPNPHNPYRGAGLIAGAPRVYDMELALTKTKTAYFENGAKLSGVLESERSINDGVLQKVKRQFIGAYAGIDNSYKVAVLERGLRFKAIQSSAHEAQFGALSDQSRDRILAMFRVPKVVLGLGSDTAVSGSVESDRRTFANGTMRPLLNRLQRAISDGLTEPGWGLKFCIEYEYQMPIEDQIRLATEIASLPGILIKEVREFAKLEPLPDDDPRGKIMLNLPGENDNESDVKDRPLGGEAGRPPNGENTRAITHGRLPDDAAAVTA